jgi:hypothetical protein
MNTFCRGNSRIFCEKIKKNEKYNYRIFCPQIIFVVVGPKGKRILFLLKILEHDLKNARTTNIFVDTLVFRRITSAEKDIKRFIISFQNIFLMVFRPHNNNDRLQGSFI